MKWDLRASPSRPCVLSRSFITPRFTAAVRLTHQDDLVSIRARTGGGRVLLRWFRRGGGVGEGVSRASFDSCLQSP